MDNKYNNNNTSNVFNIISQSREFVSVNDITERVSTSTATLSRTINKLISQGLIQVCGKEESAAGRKAVLYELNPEYKYVIGVCVTKRDIYICLGDFKGSVLDSTSYSNDSETSSDILPTMANAIENMLVKNFGDEYQSKLAMIGVCISGNVIKTPQKITVNVAGAGKWDDLDIVGYMQDRFNTPVIIEKDTNVSMMYYSESSELKNYSHLSFIKIGIGIGLATIINNHLYSRNDSDIEIRNMFVSNLGHIGRGTVVKKDELTPMESLNGIRSLQMKIYQHLLKYPESSLAYYYKKSQQDVSSYKKIDIRVIDKAASCGDVDAINILYDFITSWSEIIINVNCILVPEVVLIGGVIGQETPYIISRINRNLSEYFGKQINIIGVNDGETLQEATIISTLKYLYRHIANELS